MISRPPSSSMPLSSAIARQIDDVGRLGEPLLERRDQGRVRRPAAWPSAAPWQQRDRLGDASADDGSSNSYMVIASLFGRLLACALSWSARQTFSGVAGMAISGRRARRVTAFIIAGGAPIAPASPQPLTPSGLCVHGVAVMRDLEARQVVGARHAVVHERAGDQLAGSRRRRRSRTAPGRYPGRCRRAPGPRRSSG